MLMKKRSVIHPPVKTGGILTEAYKIITKKNDRILSLSWQEDHSFQWVVVHTLLILTNVKVIAAVTIP